MEPLDTMNDSDQKEIADPVLAALARIEGRLGALEARLGPALDLVDAAPAAAGTALDILDERLREAGEQGVDLANLLPSMGDALRAMAVTATALQQAAEAPVDHATKPLGVFGALKILKSLGDPDVQRALAFGLRFARALGQGLDHGRPDLPRLPAPSSP
jgi:uncharacterized protein YjgD (DUF1641 family)